MIAVRCTRKLLDRFHSRGTGECNESTGILGDWYANLLHTRPRQLALFMNERALLVVIIEAAPVDTLLLRFRTSVLNLLERLEIEPEQIAFEQAAMSEIAITRTASRRVLGCMNEAAFAMRVEMAISPGICAEEIEDFLAGRLYSTTGYEKPFEITERLFSQAFMTMSTGERVH